jgi:hypothetical protein
MDTVSAFTPFRDLHKVNSTGTNGLELLCRWDFEQTTSPAHGVAPPQFAEEQDDGAHDSSPTPVREW